MKKILLFIVFSLGLAYFSNAQPPRGEKIQSIFIAYVTKELNLTSEEAQRFWPVYNEYFKELKKARNENKDELVFEEKALNIRKKYKPEFKKVLNDDNRVNRVYVIDRNFKEVLRKEMMSRQKNRPKGARFQPQD
jgi:hypothetical protein